MTRQPGLLLFSSAFGILMVITAVRPAGPVGIAVLALSTLALVAGLFFRQAAALAVLLSIAAMALADPTPVFAAVSGLSAAAYLVLRYALSDGDSGSDAVTLTVPTAAGLVGFTLAGLAAGFFGPRLAWLPLAAPVLAIAILVVAVLPLWADERTGALVDEARTGALVDEARTGALVDEAGTGALVGEARTGAADAEPPA